MLWVYDVLIPALNRGRGWLEKHLWAVSMMMAAVSLAFGRGHVLLRLICLGLYLMLQRRVLRLCRRKGGKLPGIVYVSALFPLLTVFDGFLALPPVWLGCILIWAIHKR